MNHSLSQHQINLLQDCLALALNPKTQAEADRQFLDLQDSLNPDAMTAEVLQKLWAEVLAARRSAAFWEHLSDAEKAMSDGLADDHLRLQQNYLRLIQEQ
ncbi:hypothetical protein [Leptodesmis sp.]|uniref:hypothetical protein n=1 Tax=Leptodesmis sp. TaxID=3100501 RepID=UPI004053487B